MSNSSTILDELLRRLADTKLFRAIARRGSDINHLLDEISHLRHIQGGATTRAVADIQRGAYFSLIGEHERAEQQWVALARSGEVTNKGRNKLAAYVREDISAQLVAAHKLLTEGFYIYMLKDPPAPFPPAIIDSFEYWVQRLPELEYSVPMHIRDGGVFRAVNVEGPTGDQFLQRWSGQYPEAIDALLEHSVRLSVHMAAETEKTARLLYPLAEKWEEMMRASGIPITAGHEEQFELVKQYVSRNRVTAWPDRAMVQKIILVPNLEDDPRKFIQMAVDDRYALAATGIDNLDFEHPASRTVIGHILEGMYGRAPVEFGDHRRERYTEMTLGMLTDAGFDLSSHDIPLEQTLLAMRLVYSRPDYALNGPRSTRMLAAYLGISEIEYMQGNHGVDTLAANAMMLTTHHERFVEKVQSALRASE